MKIYINNRFSAKPLKYTWQNRFSKTIDSKNLPEDKTRESVLKTLLLGTIIITTLFFLLLLASYFIAGNTQVKYRLVVNLLALLYLGFTYLSLRNRQFFSGAILLIVFYIAFASLAAWQWGIGLSYATLLMSVTITLAGILLGARFSLYAAAILSLIVIIIQFTVTAQFHKADLSWHNGSQSLPGEALGYCLLFAILGLVSWIFGRQIERSLRQARYAKIALQKEKSLLAVKVKERTEKLRDAQLKEMQQLYRFAELGQISIALIHDLSNRLAALNLDIEDLESSHRSKSIKHAKESMNYLEELVTKVRQQINDSVLVRRFNCFDSIQQLSDSLKTNLVENQITLKIASTGASKNFELTGDPVRFSQVMAILIANAIEASKNSTKKRLVSIQINASVKEVNIKIKDWGSGIAPKEKNRLFKPFYSTKKSGMGLGLFIARQIITNHFKGTVSLEKYEKPTLFKITIPNGESHVHTRRSSKTNSSRTSKAPTSARQR